MNWEKYSGTYRHQQQAAVSSQHNDVGYSYARQAWGKNRSSVLIRVGTVTSSSSSVSVVTGPRVERVELNSRQTGFRFHQPSNGHRVCCRVKGPRVNVTTQLFQMLRLWIHSSVLLHTSSRRGVRSKFNYLYCIWSDSFQCFTEPQVSSLYYEVPRHGTLHWPSPVHSSAHSLLTLFVFRQVHIHFQGEFFRQGDLVIPAPRSGIFSFPQGHSVAAYVFFLVFLPLASLVCFIVRRMFFSSLTLCKFLHFSHDRSQ
jgi:hypothetical protein